MAIWLVLHEQTSKQSYIDTQIREGEREICLQGLQKVLPEQLKETLFFLLCQIIKYIDNQDLIQNMEFYFSFYFN